MLLPPSQTLSVGLARAKLAIARRACWLLPVGHQERIANAGFWGFLERADAMTTKDHALVVSGWILPDVGKVTAIRVTLGGFSCGELRVEVARPDIGLLFPKRDEAQHCGFEGRLRVPDAIHGSLALVIWADLKSGSVVQGFARHIHVPLKPLITVPLLPTADPAKRRVDADSSDERGMTAELLQKIFDPREWLSATGYMDETVRRLTEGPKFSDLGQIEGKILNLFRALSETRARSLEQSTLVLAAWTKAVSEFAGKLSEAAATKKTFSSRSEIVSLWVEIGNRHLLEAQRSPPFLETQRALLQASSNLKLAQPEDVVVEIA